MDKGIKRYNGTDDKSDLAKNYFPRTISLKKHCR